MSTLSTKREFYAAHLETIETEGGSIAGYARAHGLCAQTLYYWRRKLSGQDRFLRVRASRGEGGDEATSQLPVQIRFPNGVAVSMAADAAALPDVLRALASL